MNIYIAKHFWKNGESATWECHEKIDKELFKYLKNNYPYFSKDKPKKINIDKHFVYLCYEDGQDNYGRPIVSITFFVSRKDIKNDFCMNKNIDDLKIKILDLKTIAFSILGLIITGFGINYIYNNPNIFNT